MVLPIVATTLTGNNENPVVPFALYAHLTEHTEQQFYGIYDEHAVRYECNRYWTKAQRDWVTYYLNLAQAKLEESLNFPLSDKWVTEEMHPVKISQMYRTRWGYIEEAGVRATSLIDADSAVEYGSEPAVIGPIATTVTLESEIVVYHPGTTIPIAPSKITIAGGNVTIEIPKARLLKFEAMTNDNVNGVSCTDPDLFETEVDIYRVYTDTTDQATFTRSNENCLVPCADVDTTGCIKILNKTTGHIHATPATYANGAWSSYLSCYSYYKVFFNYKAVKPAGLDAVNILMQLAHGLMPASPCACGWVQKYWNAARFVPDDLSNKDAPRLNNPYGLMDGAFLAYRWMLYNRLIRGGIV